MDKAILPALIGATVAMLVTAIKDVCIPIVKHRLAEKEKSRTLIEKYAPPLGISALSLFYRMREMVVLKRYDYLEEAKRNNDFSLYKYISSLYRLASLLGWIRAMKLENSQLLHISKDQQAKMTNLVYEFESSLADGPHAELEILQSLSQLWDISLPECQDKKHIIANECDDVRRCTLAGQLIGSNNNDNLATLKQIAESICTAVGCSPVSDSTLKRTADEAVSILNPKQFWIYRDWQAAIGDIMIKESNTPIREFDVIGYGDFEKLYENKDKWVSRLENLLSDIDFDSSCCDYRIQQLQDILASTAQLVLKINELNIKGKPFTDDNIKHVKEYVRSVSRINANRNG